MASRERRRVERSKRKARSTERRAQIAARYEQRNRAARDALEPLPEDERPAVVTVGAMISGLIGASVVIAYLAGATVNGERPGILQVVPPAVLMGVMSFGMWRVRYWAVLGFQAVLALLILAAADITLMFRAVCEEQTLAQDAAYRTYMEQVRWRIIPGVF